MNKQYGFSLIEVTIVLAIISLFGFIMAPNYLEWRQSTKIRSVVGEFYSNMSTAKTKAIRFNTTLSVTFPSINTYVIGGAKTVSYELESGVTFTPPPATIFFDSRGIPSAAATIDFNNKKRISISRLGSMSVESI